MQRPPESQLLCGSLIRQDIGACGRVDVSPYTPALLGGRDERREVAALAVLHDDVEGGVRAVDDAVVVVDDVPVLQLAQQVHLRDEHLLLRLRHRSVVQLLPDDNLHRDRRPHDVDVRRS